MANELTTTEPVNLPAYLQDKEVVGLDEIRKYKKTPLIKVIQATAKPDLQDEFGVGSIVASGTKLVDKDKPLKVIPVFFWASWQQRRDSNDKSGHFIAEETMDEASVIAVKSRSDATRKETYPDNPNYSYVYCQSLNYAMYMVDGPLAGEVAVVKFSMGAHAVAEQMGTALSARGTSLFYNQIELTSQKTTNTNGNSWYQLNYQPAEESFTPEALVDTVEEIHKLIKEEHAAKDTKLGSEQDDE